ncbi:hypothetical protein GCM10007079_47660 [Nocardiopsis terrae]|uniref:Type VII secretion protein EccE n=1 Tax=Nocardiopsis terrae TaxID=372655 RepID=A0ABR9HAS0_9ACTN|nr:hypothetical protein [Nocardiopsis terrae]MBE1456117.1 hypothetical protein [Nocardiopsis terrae]GHC95795.1 hypothetical protein GCM10007079_47660 [Nocardiopsis terrae]
MPTPRSSATGASTPRGETGRTYIGWRHRIVLPPPGPAPRRPAPADFEALSEEWVSGQLDSEARTNRPLYFTLAGLGLLTLAFPLLWNLRILPGSLALGGVLACTAIAAPVVFALVQSRQVMADRLARARERLAEQRAERERALHEQQRRHAHRYTEWQAAARAYEAQPRWYGLTVPSGTSAVLVVGGTDAGWSALLTTIGVSRLREGGDLTVVDLTGRSVARELVNLARRCAVEPRRWVLPADLPRMTLGTNLDAGQRARILSAVAAASGQLEDVDADETLLLRLLEVLGPGVGIARLIGGLRALVTPQEDAAEDDPALALLTREERLRVRARCADDPGVRERAWALENRLSPFEAVGTRADDGAYAQVKIISTDRASGQAAARVYGTYAVAALSELLDTRAPEPSPVGGRSRGAGPDRTRSVVVCGAETLPDEEVDQVLDAAAKGGVEVVLMFRTAVPAALERFTDPACLPVVMRQPDGAEEVGNAVAAAGGAADPRRLELHRLTEVIGDEVAGPVTGPDGSEPGESADEEPLFPSPHTESGALIRNAAAAVAPLDLVRHVRSATAWGRATARAEGADTSVRSEAQERPDIRTSGLDAEALRELPPTAALVLTPDGPVVADTNPGILTLSTATLATAEDARNTGAGGGAGHGGATDGTAGDPGGGRRPPEVRPRIVPPGGAVRADTPQTPNGVDGGQAPEPVRTVDLSDPERVPPNLGPPPERLDWRV